MPGGTLASQMMRPTTTTWTESDPDMQTPSFTAGEPLSAGSVTPGKASGWPWAPGSGLDRTGHGGGAGSLMSPLLPRVPPLTYGLLRMSESPPPGLRVSGRSGEAARAGLETGTSRSTDEAGEARKAAGGAGRSTSVFLSGLAIASGGMSDPAGMIWSARWGSANPAPDPPPTTIAQTISDARRRPVTEPV
jgi:hypothetical protein